MINNSVVNIRQLRVFCFIVLCFFIVIANVVIYFVIGKRMVKNVLILGLFSVVEWGIFLC